MPFIEWPDDEIRADGHKQGDEHLATDGALMSGGNERKGIGE